MYNMDADEHLFTTALKPTFLYAMAQMHVVNKLDIYTPVFIILHI